MVKTIGIEKDASGTLYLSMREERSDPDSKRITLETSRNQVIVTEREGHIKRQHHGGDEYRENRPSTFKGTDAPAKAAQYLIQKYNLTIVELQGRP